MNLRPAFLILCASLLGSAMGRDASIADGRAKRLQKVITRLESAPSGAQLLVRARKLWKLAPHASIQPFIAWGPASKTDAILTRSFDPVTERETRHREVRINLREDADTPDLLLDLAHELVHATSTPSWDPYDPQLTAGQYVKNALEGKGGEVEAVYAECKVALELRPQLEGSSTLARCEGYFSRTPASETLSARERITHDFYRVGSQHARARALLGEPSPEEFPYLSAEPVRLYSSTGGTPYPLALVAEFQELNRIACENSERRLASQSHAEGRHASQRKAQLTQFIQARCSQHKPRD